MKHVRRRVAKLNYQENEAKQSKEEEEEEASRDFMMEASVSVILATWAHFNCQ